MTAKYNLPDMVHIPAGEFIMGSDPTVDKVIPKMSRFYSGYLRGYEEQPQHKLYVDDFYIALTPITSQQYADFVNATDYPVPVSTKDDRAWMKPFHWVDGNAPQGLEDHPVVYVTWADALAYCHWLCETTGDSYTLPGEAQWEKAARGTDARIYPWDDEWHDTYCNSYHYLEDNAKATTTPVGSFPDGASPYGVLDMSGNVSEWTTGLFGPHNEQLDYKYPYIANDGREDMRLRGVMRATRGGAYYLQKENIRCAAKIPYSDTGKHDHIGFRVIKLP